MRDIMVFERVIDLPRVIVWDALVDPVLVEGWLHPTALLVDGTELLDYDEGDSLAVDSPELGNLAITLSELAGGTRGTSTHVKVEVAPPVDHRLRAPLAASWLTRLDQLEALLRGHPVDWSRWDEEYGPDYAEYLAGAAL